MSTNYCVQCGTSAIQTIRFCPNCGSERFAAEPPARVRAQTQPPQTSVFGNAGPSGLGGWMVLPIFGLIMSIFFLLFGAAGLIPVLEKAGADSSSLKLLLWVEFFANIGLGLFAIYLCVLLFKKKQRFPMLVIRFYFLILLVKILDAAIAFQLFGVTLDTEDVKDMARAFWACVIWIPYFMKSKRVKNTFVNP